jgi:cobalt/nickel transport system permease protein
MHIPDGYLSPIMSVGAGVVTVPAWAVAVRKVQAVLNQRTVPLLAIFSAFTFTIMMFNVPVPGGTTAHAVGGTLIAVVLGPWAAVLGVSMALILQALFFGDGGILAIFINCMNMGVILPFVGYFSYRLIAGRSPILSTRRIWAAGIGAYIGITAAALAVGVELGLQPILFTENGHPLYSPYGLDAAIPAMLVAHAVGASIVEALVTALGVAYLQKNYPQYLTSLRKIVAGSDVAEGQVTKQPVWQIALIGVGIALVILFVGGLIAGGGDVGKLFGADWSQVNWSDVAVMLLIVGIIAAVLVPLAWFLLPRRIKKLGTIALGVAIIAPLGLIAPGFAYGEGSVEDINKAFGYVPQGLKDLSGIFSAPLSGYNLPFPPFNGDNAQLWQQAIGYEIAGIIGILVLGGLVYGLAMLIRRRGPIGDEDGSGPGSVSTDKTKAPTSGGV